ncbi:MAG: carboxypeptidase-like regulatory domain-containing protein [Bryobacteraceae bacterium]
MRSFAILLVASLALESAQTQAGGKKEPAIAEGQVVSAATGEPVVRAQVTIKPKVQSSDWQDAPGGFAMRTDDGGTFHFEKLEPGKYEISVVKAGYLGAKYGAKRANGPGVPVELQAGQTTSKLDIRMYPEATVSGVVTDDQGEPVECEVALLMRGWKQGKPILRTSGGDGSDGQGHFHISGVVPGKYFIRAQESELPMGRPPREVDRQGNPVNVRLVPTFYGDTTSFENAIALQVQSGQEVTDVNIKMRREPGFHIRGRIVSVPPGDSALNYTPYLRTNEPFASWAGSSTRPKKNGEFEIDDVQRGSYVLELASQVGRNGSGSVPVEVSDGNIDNLEIPIQPAADVHGRLVVEDRGDADLSTARVYFSTSEGYMPGNAVASVDGSFIMRDLAPNHYQIRVEVPGQELFVKSVRLSAREMTDKSLDLTQGTGQVEIVLSFSPAKLEGTVTRDDPDSHAAVAASAVSVVLIPEKKTDEFLGGIKYSSTDAQGHFTFRSIEPGRYKAFAYDGFDTNLWLNPELAKALDSRGVEIELNEKDSKQIQLTLITQEEAAAVLNQLGL